MKALVGLLSLLLVFGVGCKSSSTKSPSSGKKEFVTHGEKSKVISEETVSAIKPKNQKLSVESIDAEEMGPIAKIILQMQKELEENNPNFQRDNLPELLDRIRIHAGYHVSCDEDLSERYIADCYRAVQNFLLAIDSQLGLPENPSDGYPIEEILLHMESKNRFFSAADGRYNLEINYKMTPEKWVDLLKSQVNQSGRLNMVYRSGQMDALVAELEKRTGYLIGLTEEVSGVDEDRGLTELEQGVRLIERVFDYSEQVVAAAIAENPELAKQDLDVLKNKVFRYIEIGEESEPVTEHLGELILRLDGRLDTEEAFFHLLLQGSQLVRGYSALQEKLLRDKYDDQEMQVLEKVAIRQHDDWLELKLNEEKVAELISDIELNMTSSVNIHCNLSQNSKWFRKEGVTVEQCYQGLITLREGLSGGELGELGVTNIILGNPGVNSTRDKKTPNIVLQWSANGPKMFDALWRTTPEGEIQEQKDAARLQRMMMQGM